MREPMSLPAPDQTVASWSLAHEIQSVCDEAVLKRTRIARTLLKTTEVRVVAVGMARGVTWPEHKAAGRVLIRIEFGCIRLRARQSSSQFSAGMLVALEPGEPHDLYAVEDTALLLLVAG
jgi:quercetin dioxygenase-like cupin family protein